MPIRMEKDSPGQQPGNGGRQQSGGGSNALLRFLPLILLFVFKRPKLLIPILAVGAVWYFFFGGQELFSGGGYEEDSATPQFSLGAALDEEVYDKALVFEPISYGYSGQASLPARASLERFAPKRRHQGRQGSCVGWASAYAARSILQAETSGQDPNSVAFSPAYLYNQIALSGCQGAYMVEAMKTMQQYGGLPFDQFRYNDATCANEPTSAQKQAGQQYRIQGFDRLTVGAEDYKPDLAGIKQHLAQGYPVVIGMMVGGSFMGDMMGQSVWQPTQRDYSMRGFSGHAMCTIGYDDNKDGGAFQIMNSWGEDWGNQGISWVRYRDFEYFVKEAYGVYPTASSQDKSSMAVEFGLMDVNTQNIIGLFKKEDAVFRTIKPISKGDKFKVLIANSIECYTYVFGQETDGSSYVLFPYTEKHSPYCGITGTRLFPRDYSMVADQVGNKDFIAVVISKEPLDFQQFNTRINSSRAADYAGKLREALGSNRIENVEYKAGKTVSFEANAETRPAVGMIIEIDKQ
ncbi:MAG: peptidase C1 [Phaeodactylibacter sp.]|nr:peptidase C1 [Phaeodactylibacter sp.]MCB9274585.1 peptidase C1 [Lewinellaceae bacterium]